MRVPSAATGYAEPEPRAHLVPRALIGPGRQPVLVESFAFVLIGLAVGAGALTLLPEYFPAARSLTVGTGVVAALLSGLISRFTLDAGLPALSLAISAIGSALLVSVLARPEPAAEHGRHRHA
ncbi:hypothetical protein GCM10010430_45920 [Kitasatospora cystarginea]|uniref:Integral membrane protein n=1 Tax=Kitasatospora cystarginea TaxID=58350 RepID=A0ABN3EF31_9ACTN